MGRGCVYEVMPCALFDDVIILRVDLHAGQLLNYTTFVFQIFILDTKSLENRVYKVS